MKALIGSKSRISICSPCFSIYAYERLKRKLNDIEDDIASNPLIGEEKKVDIKGIRVYKFKLLDQQILLAYQVNEDKKEVIFVAAGGHENFYRDLKRYIK